MGVKEIIILILVGAGASFVQRVSGFGLGIFAMLFLPHFLPSPAAAASVSTLFSCVTSSYNGIRYRKDISFPTVLPVLGAALVAIPIAVYFSGNISGEVFSVILGIVLILLSMYFIFWGQNIRFRPTPFKGALAGFAGGALNGLFATGGPPIVLYLTNATTENHVYFASIQFYFAIANIYATVFRIANGLITGQVLLFTAVGLVGCFFGDLAGRKLFKKLNANVLKRIIYIAMILSGIVMIVNNIHI